MSPRRNWDSPTPFPQASAPPPSLCDTNNEFCLTPNVHDTAKTAQKL